MGQLDAVRPRGKYVRPRVAEAHLLSAGAGFSTSAACHAKAAAASVALAHSHPPPIARLPEGTRLRERTRRRGNCCRRHTSLFQLSSNHDSADKLEAASAPFDSPLAQKRTTLPAGQIPSLPPGLAVGFGSKGTLLTGVRFTPVELWIPRSRRRVRHRSARYTSSDNS